MSTIINGKSKLDKETPIPLYFQLKELIKDKIENGDLEEGDLLPPERELAEHFDVSRPTVRQALKELVNEGLLRREKGRGTYVAEGKINYGFIQKLTTFYDDMEEKGYKLKTEVLIQELRDPREFIASRLNISADDKVVFLKRIRYVEEEPIVTVHNFVPSKLCPGLEKVNLENKSLYETIGKEYGLLYSKAEISLEPAVADQDDQKYLKVDKGAPIHLMKNITYAQSGVIFDYFESRFRGDKGKIKVRLVNNS